nr:MAG TPA: hypothetical protein [Caudoviricetes sp.]
MINIERIPQTIAMFDMMFAFLQFPIISSQVL